MLHEIDRFTSYDEFESLVKALTYMLQQGEIEEVEPKDVYIKGYLGKRERWFKDVSSNGLWRLIPPDFPFEGFFEKI